MKVTGFWSAAGLVIAGLIIADLMLHPTGTKTAFNGLTGFQSVVGNQLIGAKAT